MPDIISLIEQGNVNLFIFIPVVIMLGALHGLEPGHSKTMMAAFIVSIRGTVRQAILLGIATTISHTAIVWIISLSGMYFMKGQVDSKIFEPYLQMLSGALMIIIAGWMTYRNIKHHQQFTDHKHHNLKSKNVKQEMEVIDIVSPEYQDAHTLAHAQEIHKHFAGKKVSTGQIIAFGLTGGLIPCPASITVLLLCLQLKKIALGSLLVLCFSIGLALVLTCTGAIAAISVNTASKRWSGFSIIAQKAPYFSGAVIALIGIYVFCHGLSSI